MFSITSVSRKGRSEMNHIGDHYTSSSLHCTGKRVIGLKLKQPNQQMYECYVSCHTRYLGIDNVAAITKYVAIHIDMSYALINQ